MCFKSKTCTLLFLMLVVTDLMWVSSGWTIRPSMMQPLQLLCSSQVCNRGYMSWWWRRYDFLKNTSLQQQWRILDAKQCNIAAAQDSWPDRCRSRLAATWWGSSGWSLPPIEAERGPSYWEGRAPSVATCYISHYSQPPPPLPLKPLPTDYHPHLHI